RAKSHLTALHVRWRAPLSDGGSRIRSYRVRAAAIPEGDIKHRKTPPAVIVDTKTGAARAATLHGLRAGWTYRITVWAVTKRGRSLPGLAPHTHLIHVGA
ncbi:MAG TPA: fibronectin type III domain-containing protein, partial [Mycobacteriales bacterium]|nr:fibronectin type III domain-containing protein [Mycobacteriales bacterium]